MAKRKVWQALVHQTPCINVNAHPEYSSYLTLWAVEAGPVSWFIPTSKNILLETPVFSFVLLLPISNFYKEIVLQKNIIFFYYREMIMIYLDLSNLKS